MTPVLELVPSTQFANLRELNKIDEYDSFLEYYKWQKQNRKRLNQELEEVFSECSQANWDGYGAKPITNFTHREAEIFLDGLPVILPSPHIVPQPDGGVAFEWSGEENKTFVASLNGDGLIYFSWYFGSPESGGSGREKLSENIPRHITRHIRFVCGEDDE